MPYSIGSTQSICETYYPHPASFPHLTSRLYHSRISSPPKRDLICRIQRCSPWHAYVSLDPISHLTLFIYIQTVCDNVSHHRLPLIQTAASPTSTVPRADLHGWSKSEAPVFARHGLMM
jgi:hypothetical protein